MRIADVAAVVHEIVGYDIVVMGDVIEHFDKALGLSVLRTLLTQNRNVIVTTPFQYFDQETEDNPFQRPAAIGPSTTSPIGILAMT